MQGRAAPRRPQPPPASRSRSPAGAPRRGRAARPALCPLPSRSAPRTHPRLRQPRSSPSSFLPVGAGEPRVPQPLLPAGSRRPPLKPSSLPSAVAHPPSPHPFFFLSFFFPLPRYPDGAPSQRLARRMLAAPPPRAEPRPPLSQRHGPPRTAAAAGWPGARRLSGVRSPAGGAAAAVSAGRGTRPPPQRGEGGGTSPSRSIAEPDLSPSPLEEREGEEFGPALLVYAFELPLPPLSLETGARKRPLRGCRQLGSRRRRSLPRPRPGMPARRPPSGGSLKPPRFGEGVLAARSSGRCASPESSHSAAGKAPFAKFRHNSAEMPARCMAAEPSARVNPLCPSGASAPLARAGRRGDSMGRGPVPSGPVLSPDGAGGTRGGCGLNAVSRWSKPCGGATIRQPEENGKGLGKK